MCSVFASQYRLYLTNIHDILDHNKLRCGSRSVQILQQSSQRLSLQRLRHNLCSNNVRPVFKLSFQTACYRENSRHLVDKMAASSAESNATCQLIRQLADSILRRNDDDDDDEPAIFTSGHESAKYMLTEVINPVLCVVWLRPRPGLAYPIYFHFRSVRRRGHGIGGRRTSETE